ncbi:tripeptidyl-peptidase-like protein [Saccharata proteae CBS 121410]|uniref:tripeptidyl-peptidase II n=1 Tax=Saccharata proteae CBS 121410 TaxID=1314787 RepID=A0A9P4HZ13_9PEZI|nr:tripeptidyl-peptidase-like protein [Saccharata proteae CBS 121410]
MRATTLFAGLAAFAGAINAFSTSGIELMDSLRGVPDNWHLVRSPDASQKLRFMIAVKQPNQALFEQTLLEISTPGHVNYGQHFKRDELKAMLRPKAEATDSIIRWLRDSGIQNDDIEDDGEWINFVATVSQAEKLMATKFQVYQSSIRKSVEKIRTLQYYVPQELHEHITMIQPTTRFAQIRPERSSVLTKQKIGHAHTGLNVTACNATITPTCLKELYNIKGYEPSPGACDFLGVNGFLEEYARYADLKTFEAEYAPWAIGQSFNFQSINGSTLPQNTTDDSVEANLDIQYTVPLVYPLQVDYYYTAGRGPLVPDLDQPDDGSNEPYLSFFTEILKMDDEDLPTTLTTSYGEDEQSVPETFAKTVCDMIGQLGARGVSVLFSSGDTGPGSACQTNDGKNTTRFLPIFPASCPYVTSVGGTYHIEPEQAVSFSSGGFSDIWERPSWQDAAVAEYLGILGDRWDGLYNPAGRGFPDVAAQAYRFHVVDQGEEILVGGTSAASPTFASVIALLNSARVEKGLSGLGWLNPWLYSQGKDGLTDIVKGGSSGCTGIDSYSGLPSPYVPYAGWNATKGWDPATGLGTPDFQALLKMVT